MRRLVASGTLLILVSLAFLFRWAVVTPAGPTAFFFKIDRWTSQTWMVDGTGLDAGVSEIPALQGASAEPTASAPGTSSNNGWSWENSDSSGEGTAEKTGRSWDELLQETSSGSTELQEEQIRNVRDQATLVGWLILAACLTWFLFEAFRFRPVKAERILASKDESQSSMSDCAPTHARSSSAV